jgi:hypothetical protein
VQNGALGNVRAIEMFCEFFERGLDAVNNWLLAREGEVVGSSEA